MTEEGRFSEVCVTMNCERFNSCKRSIVNNEGTYYVRSYGTEGSGTVDNTGAHTESLCGKAGDYKLFEPVSHTEEDGSSEKILDMLDHFYANKHMYKKLQEQEKA